MKEKMFVLVSIIVLMLVSSGISVTALRTGDNQLLDTATDTSVNQNTGKEVIIIIGISVYEAWDLLTNTSNGIQIPIDLRTDGEWNTGWLDTPYPECPIHYPLAWLQNATRLQEFLEKYGDKEVVLYCKTGGGRCKQALMILSETNFSGIIYYISGGIVAWMAAGFPIRTNAPPNAPDIDGPTKIKVNKQYNFTFNATDPNNDGVKYFIDWGDGFSQWTEYNYSSKDITVSHTWSKKGITNITAKTMDFYGNESDWGYLEVTIPQNLQIYKSSQRYLNNHNLPSSLLLQQMVRTNK